MTQATTIPDWTLGLDIGDRWCQYHLIDRDGKDVARGRVETTTAKLQQFFASFPPRRVIMEVGPRSPWIARLAAAAGHEVFVANTRKVRLIYQAADKSDQTDAERLARLGRFDVRLLAPIQHSSAEVQAHRIYLDSRDFFVRRRAAAVNFVRSTVKAMGEALPAGISTAAFARRVRPLIPEPLRPALWPVLDEIDWLSQRIAAADREVERLCREVYPQTALLLAIRGVGWQTALAFVLKIGDPARFRRSRRVAAYLGIAPGRAQSGDRDPRQHITRHGDELVRRLLVQCAHYILGRWGIDSDLRRFGLRIAESGGVAARRRAVIAVARKLAVLLHRLLVTGMVYEPLHQESESQAA